LEQYDQRHKTLHSNNWYWHLQDQCKRHWQKKGASSNAKDIVVLVFLQMDNLLTTNAKDIVMAF